MYIINVTKLFQTNDHQHNKNRWRIYFNCYTEVFKIKIVFSYLLHYALAYLTVLLFCMRPDLHWWYISFNQQLVFNLFLSNSLSLTLSLTTLLMVFWGWNAQKYTDSDNVNVMLRQIKKGNNITQHLKIYPRHWMWDQQEPWEKTDLQIINYCKLL